MSWDGFVDTFSTWKTGSGGILTVGGLVLSFCGGGMAVGGLAGVGIGMGLFGTGYNEKLTQESLDKSEKRGLEQANLSSKMEFVNMLSGAAIGSTMLRSGIRKVKMQHEGFQKFGLDGSQYKSAKAVEELAGKRESYFTGRR